MICMPADITIEKKAAKDVTKLLEKHENAAVSRYLRKFLDDWRHQKVCIAVYGSKTCIIVALPVYHNNPLVCFIFFSFFRRQRPRKVAIDQYATWDKFCVYRDKFVHIAYAVRVSVQLKYTVLGAATDCKRRSLQER